MGSSAIKEKANRYSHILCIKIYDSRAEPSIFFGSPVGSRSKLDHTTPHQVRPPDHTFSFLLIVAQTFERFSCRQWRELIGRVRLMVQVRHEMQPRDGCERETQSQNVTEHQRCALWIHKESDPLRVVSPMSR